MTLAAHEEFTLRKPPNQPVCAMPAHNRPAALHSGRHKGHQRKRDLALFYDSTT